MTMSEGTSTGRRKTPAERAAEKELVEQVAAGSEDALSQLYDRYSGLLLGLAQRILGDRGEAEEVVQEAFLQVWRQASRYESTRSSVSTWLVLILRSRSIDRLRSRNVKERTAQSAHAEKSVTHESPEGPRDVLTQERRERLRLELDQLPEAQREVLELAFYGGMTQREISEARGIPLGTVKTRTLLAMRKLREVLREDVRDLL